MNTLSKILYRLARDSRNFKAASKGPVQLAKRLIRIRVLRSVNKHTLRLLRKAGI